MDADLFCHKFLHISKSQQPRRLRNAPANRNDQRPKQERDFVAGRPRSLSEGTVDENGAVDMIDRMKKTVAFNYRGFKGNVRGDFIQEPLTTLEEMLKSLPESLGFNIEISTLPSLMAQSRIVSVLKCLRVSNALRM